MELVYLWVEDYKNIKQQGFNFSPRFDCRYDEKNNTLDIKPKEHLENFFGENINITAIVGENGSGKSNLLNLILDIDGWATTPNKVLYLTIKNNKLFLYLVNFSNTITCNYDLEQHIIDRKTTGHARLSLANMGINCSYLSLSPFLHKINNFYSNSSIDFLSIYNYEEGYENKTFNFNDFFFSLIPRIPSLLEHDLINSFFKMQGKPKYLVFTLSEHIETLFPDEVKKILESSTEKKTTDNTYIYMIDVTSYSTIHLLKELHEKIEKKKEELSKQINDLSNIKVKKYIPNINDQDAIRSVNLGKELKNNRDQKKLSDLKTELSNIRTLELYFTDAKSSREFYFSTGELVLLFYIKKLQDVNQYDKDVILLIDECELFLHPEWQKKFIKFLSELFKNTKYNRQIIISSHSPFILSDLPKDNVIFLEDGKQKDVDINPFGANIHTLLSHGFFMKDGLMGEFAKEKIEDAINYLNNKESTIKSNDEAQKLLNIIGEPIIKNQLQKMLDSKRLSKIDEIDNIKSEMKNLAKRLEELEK